MDKIDRLGWAVGRYYRVGGVHFGLRTTSAALGEWLTDVLRTYEVPDEAGFRYSLVVPDGEATDARTKRLCIMYLGVAPLVRTLHLRTVVDALFGDIEAMLFHERRDAIYIRAAAVALNGCVALVPAPLLYSLDSRRACRYGLKLSTTLHVAYDPAAGRIVPVRSRLELAGGTDPPFTIDGVRDAGTVEMPASVDALGMIGRDTPRLQAVSRPTMLFHLASATRNLGALGGAGLRGLAELVSTSSCYAMPHPAGSNAAAEVLTALLEGAGAVPETGRSELLKAGTNEGRAPTS